MDDTFSYEAAEKMLQWLRKLSALLNERPHMMARSTDYWESCQYEVDRRKLWTEALMRVLRTWMTTMPSLKSLYDWITLRPDSKEVVAGIYLPNKGRSIPDERATVVSSNAAEIPVGSRVLVRPNAGEQFTHAGTRYRRVEVEDVLCLVEEE